MIGRLTEMRGCQWWEGPKFRGSKREISFGRILIPAFPPGEKGNGSTGGWTDWMTGENKQLPAKAPEGCRSTGRL